MNAPLARDQHGNAFDLPDEAAHWRVRRQTGGRPADILGRNGEPLYIPIASDLSELRVHGCVGSIRLDAVDGERRPLSAQAVYVDLGNSEEVRRVAPSEGDKDLVRSCFDSMTRTMEGMQRAQVERERTLAQKEQALTESQIASQKMTVELMIALLDRVGGGKPQDALSMIKQQFEIQKALEKQGGQRNAEPVPIPAPVEPKDDKWLWLKTAMPFLLMNLQEFAVSTFAGGDAAKAEGLRQSIGTFANMVGAMNGAPPSSPPFGGLASPPLSAAPARESVEQPPVTQAEEDEEDESRPIAPKAIRGILALLEDDEATAFSEFLDGLTVERYATACKEADSISTIEERLVWARRVISQNSAQAQPATAPQTTQSTPAAATTTPAVEAPSTFAVPGLPPEFAKVLARLTPEERALGLQLISWLDRATIEKVIADLSTASPGEALQRIRSMIDEARRRGPSVAHRAVASAFSGKNGTPNHGGAP